jgi:hypothetical protein
VDLNKHTSSNVQKSKHSFDLPNAYLTAIHNDGGTRKRFGKSF